MGITNKLTRKNVPQYYYFPSLDKNLVTHPVDAPHSSFLQDDQSVRTVEGAYTPRSRSIQTRSACSTYHGRETSNIGLSPRTQGHDGARPKWTTKRGWIVAKLKLQLFRRMDPDSDEDPYSDPLDILVDWTMQFFHKQISGIPPLNTNVYTLLDVLSAKRFEYTSRVTGEGAEPVSSKCLQETRPIGIALEEQHRHRQFPIYHPKDYHIPLSHDDITSPPELRKVQVKREDCFFKHILPGDMRRTTREVSTYAKIAAANFEHDAHVPRLVGLITDVSSSRLIGLLISYMECDPKKALSCHGVPTDNESLCNEFIRQVSHSVEVLHAHDIVWGDAKTENLLMDIHNNAWLIDFGGGFTHGWVDKELTETNDCDLQGLQRIEDFLLQAHI